jgi:uncharacterized protein (DUF427 family)
LTERPQRRRPSDGINSARESWSYRGNTRPDFAEEPGPGRESVWDYPRPPAVVHDTRPVLVRADGTTIAESHDAIRVLETASPPTLYLPRKDVALDRLELATGSSLCEWKGTARYYDVVTDSRRFPKAAWSYASPFPEFEALAGYFAFYPHDLECTVAGERVRPQGGGFYGGWVTDEIAGPWKGEPGSGAW